MDPMNTSLNTPPNEPTPAIDRDVLIARLVDRCATDADWLAVRTVALADSSFWGDVASSQHHASLLVQASSPAQQRANLTDLPTLDGHAALPRLEQLRGWPDRLSFSRSSRLGWAIAALVALAWTTQHFVPARPSLTAVQPGVTAGIASVLTPDEALSTYLEQGRQQGRVVGEMPQRVVIESRPLADGKGYEVLYLRQILERAHVSDVYRESTGEAGERIFVPASPPVVRTGRLGL